MIINFMQLPKKTKASVVKVRKAINKLQSEQEMMIKELSKQLGIKIDSEEFETLWDHVMNGTTWTVEYTNEKE